MNDIQSQKLFIDQKCHRPFETLIGTHTKKNDIFKLQKMQINHTKNRADFKSPYALAISYGSNSVLILATKKHPF